MELQPSLPIDAGSDYLALDGSVVSIRVTPSSDHGGFSFHRGSFAQPNVSATKQNVVCRFGHNTEIGGAQTDVNYSTSGLSFESWYEGIANYPGPNIYDKACETHLFYKAPGQTSEQRMITGYFSFREAEGMTTTARNALGLNAQQLYWGDANGQGERFQILATNPDGTESGIYTTGIKNFQFTTFDSKQLVGMSLSKEIAMTVVRDGSVFTLQRSGEMYLDVSGSTRPANSATMIDVRGADRKFSGTTQQLMILRKADGTGMLTISQVGTHVIFGGLLSLGGNYQAPSALTFYPGSYTVIDPPDLYFRATRYRHNGLVTVDATHKKWLVIDEATGDTYAFTGTKE